MCKCRYCSSKKLVEIINLGNLPIAHNMLNSFEDDKNVYPLVLHFCQSCGLVQICKPIDAKTLYLDYNYCFSTWKLQPHKKDETNIILQSLGNGSVFEIACNDGMFLESLKINGANLVVGLEPNSVTSKIASKKGFPVYQEMLTESVCKEAVKKFGKFKTVVARQVLEHLPDLKNFFKCIDILLDKEGFLFIDIPDIEKHMMIGDITVIWEEHVNYFAESVIKTLLKKFGYSPILIKRYNFSGGIIAINSKRTQPQISFVQYTNDKFTKDVFNFKNKTKMYGDVIKKTLTNFRNKGFKIALYGVGCRACTFVNAHKMKDYIDFAIDDQKERQGKYMPGSKLQVVSPEILQKNRSPLLCLLAVNQENESKVKEKLRNIAKTQLEFISVLSPTNIWTEIKNIQGSH